MENILKIFFELGKKSIDKFLKIVYTVGRNKKGGFKMDKKDYQAVIDLTREELGIKYPIEVKIKDVYGGRANKNYITLPKWLDKYSQWYQIYYAIHETCHYLPEGSIEGKKLRGHTELFKKDEDRILKLWGIDIERTKAYPKKLFVDGQRIKILYDDIKGRK